MYVVGYDRGLGDQVREEHRDVGRRNKRKVRSTTSYPPRRTTICLATEHTGLRCFPGRNTNSRLFHLKTDPLWARQFLFGQVEDEPTVPCRPSRGEKQMVREVGSRHAEERSSVGIKCFQDRIPDCDKEIRSMGTGMSMSMSTFMCRLSNQHGPHQPGIDRKVTTRLDPRVAEST